MENGKRKVQNREEDLKQQTRLVVRAILKHPLA
jgi:hypothetical protein